MDVVDPGSTFFTQSARSDAKARRRQRKDRTGRDASKERRRIPAHRRPGGHHGVSTRGNGAIASKLAPTGEFAPRWQDSCRSELARDEHPRRPRPIPHQQGPTRITQSPQESATGFPSPVWRAEHRSERRTRPRSGTRQDGESAQSAHGRAVCAPRLSREAQGHPAVIGPVTGAAWPSGEASRSSRSNQDSRPIAAGRASQGTLSLLPFFSCKRKEVARGQRAKPEPHRQPARAGNDTAVGAVERLFTPTPCVGLKPDLRPYQCPCQRPGQPPGHADQNHHA